MAMPWGSELLLPLSSLIVTVPALAVSALCEKPRPLPSVALMSIAELPPPAELLPVDAPPEPLLDALVDGVLVPPAPDVVLLPLDPPPHAASAPLTSSRAAVSTPQRRLVAIGTGS